MKMLQATKNTSNHNDVDHLVASIAAEAAESTPRYQYDIYPSAWCLFSLSFSHHRSFVAQNALLLPTACMPSWKQHATI